MKVTTIELFSRNYEVIDFVLQFSTINNDKGLFVLYVEDKANDVFLVESFATYFVLFGILEATPIEEDEKIEFIKEITNEKYKDYWLKALKDENDEIEYLTTDRALAEWEEYKDMGNADDDNCFSYFFNNDSLIQVEKNNEGGYNVALTQVEENKDDVIQTATFNNFENMVYGIAPFCQKNFQDEYEMAGFVSHLFYSFVSLDEDVEKFRDELGEMIMK